MNVLIPSVGRKRYLVGAFHAALKDNDGQLFVSDLDDNALALGAGGVRVALPSFGDDGFWPAVDRTIEENAIDAVVPVRDAELVGWAERAETGALGAKVCLSPSPTLRVCRDKVQLYARAAAVGVQSPKTWRREEWNKPTENWPGQLIAKPVMGSGSRGIRLLQSANQFAEVEESLEGYLVQDWIDGPEFSVDCFFGGRVDQPPQCLVRQRLEVRDGECVRARVIERADLESLVQQLAKALPFQGVVNFQFVEGNQGPLLIDVNPRFPGGLKISAAHGFAAVSETLKLLESGPWVDEVSQGTRV